MLDAFPEARGRTSLTVIGVGNDWRGDDAAGLEVARRVRGIECDGDCSALVELFDGRHDVVIVDAAASGAPAGTVHDLDARGLPPGLLRSSTHAFGVPEAVELARGLARLPRRVRIYAIEGADFAAGRGLSPAVERAVERLARDLAR